MTAMLARLRGFRTVLFNVFMALVNFAVAFDWQPYVPSRYLVWLTLFQAVGNVTLRALTTTPIFQKPDPEAEK